MARHAIRRHRQPATHRSMGRTILVACVLIAGTVALYTGSRLARSSVEVPAFARWPPGAVAQQPFPAARGVQMIVPEDRQTFLAATRLPDGRVVLSHATAQPLAESSAQSGSSSDPLTSSKESRHDR